MTSRPAPELITSYDAALDLLGDAFARRQVVVLTGAGLSTDSGIPDYRGPNSVARSPMTYQEFVAGARQQRRYWARSYVGWSRMAHAEPNAGHRALAVLDPLLLITQNVDGLHERAGSRALVALHGRIADVICLQCRRTSPRDAFQQDLGRLNPDFLDRFPSVEKLPDGDAAVDETDDFLVPACPECGGPVKPDVVFFGENVPADRVTRCYAAVEALGQGGVLLVAGSSLTVMSGLRFVRSAAKQGTPVVIVNRGETRGDPLATYRIDAGCSQFLSTLATAD
jgi:NAD-dependent SIR2 family protein deacetylase